MDWTAAIDLYCERRSAAFWASVAARRRGGATPAFRVLVGLAALVGLGSFLFHTFATVWSEYADTIPIWSFVAATIYVAASRIAGVQPGPVVGGDCQEFRVRAGG